MTEGYSPAKLAGLTVLVRLLGVGFVITGLALLLNAIMDWNHVVASGLAFLICSVVGIGLLLVDPVTEQDLQRGRVSRSPD